MCNAQGRGMGWVGNAGKLIATHKKRTTRAQIQITIDINFLLKGIIKTKRSFAQWTSPPLGQSYILLHLTSVDYLCTPSPVEEEVLIATCKQLVWSIRIGRNMPIWVLWLIPGSGPGAALPLEVTGCGVRSLLYTELPERPWVVLLSTLLLLSYSSLSLGLSFFRLLTFSVWGREFIGWVRTVSTQGVIWASAEASDPVAPPLNLVLYMHLRTFA